MSVFTKYIQNEEHYSEVISRIAKVRNTLWIGTADIKDVYVKQDGEAIPLLGQLATLLKRGVGVRLIHAKEPGPNFREDFDRFKILATDLERVMCPRVPFQDDDFRFGNGLHRVRKLDRCWHRHEEFSSP